MLTDRLNPAHWAGGHVYWYYNPANQPADLDQEAVLGAITTAANRWSAVCRLTFTYMGITQARPSVEAVPPARDRLNVFGWGLLPGTLAGGGAAAWKFFSNGLLTDADVLINTTRQWNLADLVAVMTHGIGHVIGLSHSDVAESIMFANPYHPYAYQRTLRGDDVNGCAQLYGAVPSALAVRTLNWAEWNYAKVLWPSPALPKTDGDNYYRYYAGTKSLLRINNDYVYYTGSDGVEQKMGALKEFYADVVKQGF